MFVPFQPNRLRLRTLQWGRNIVYTKYNISTIQTHFSNNFVQRTNIQAGICYSAGAVDDCCLFDSLSFQSMSCVAVYIASEFVDFDWFFLPRCYTATNKLWNSPNFSEKVRICCSLPCIGWRYTCCHTASCSEESNVTLLMHLIVDFMLAVFSERHLSVNLVSHFSVASLNLFHTEKPRYSFRFTEVNDVSKFDRNRPWRKRVLNTC